MSSTTILPKLYSDKFQMILTEWITITDNGDIVFFRSFRPIVVHDLSSEDESKSSESKLKQYQHRTINESAI